MIGTDRQVCDVPLEPLCNPKPSETNNLGPRAFAIDFNWQSGCLRVCNLSKDGVSIQSDSEDADEFGMLLLAEIESMQMLRPSEPTRLHVEDHEFLLTIPLRSNTDQDDYGRRFANFRRKCIQMEPAIEKLSVDTPFIKITHTSQRRKGQGGWYNIQDHIGSGAFGTVCVATDCETAYAYAVKTFKGPKTDATDAEQSLAEIHREIDLSLTVEHVSMPPYHTAFE